LRLSRQTVIADDMAQIISELGERAKHAEYLVVFGGLGPTTDDLTVDAACKLTNDVPAVDPVARKKMESLYRTRGREITENALRQVRYPSRARVLPNEEGLAPGFV